MYRQRINAADRKREAINDQTRVYAMFACVEDVMMAGNWYHYEISVSQM